MSNTATTQVVPIHSLSAPDLAAASEFLNALDPSASAHTFQTFPDAKGRRGMTTTHRASLNDASKLLASANQMGSGVFVTVNATDESGRRRTENFERVRAVWAELDDGLPDRDWPLAPSIIVQSSPGKYHVYWLVSDCMSSAEFKGVMARLVQDWQADKNACDLTRVLRVPGYWHLKSSPVQVLLNECHADRRYATEDLLAAFPPVVTPANDNTRRALQGHATDFDAGDFAACQSALEFLADKDLEQPDADGTYTHCADDRATWIKFGIALKREFGEAGFDLWNDWSKASDKYDESDARKRWEGFPIDEASHSRSVTTASIFHLARHHGWQRPRINPVASIAIDKDFVPADDLTPLQWGKAVSDWTSERIHELMQRMGRTYAFIEARPCYIRREPDGHINLLTIDQMRQTFGGVYEHGGGSRRTAFHAFEAWPGRTVHRDLGFYPGSDRNPPSVPEGHLNTWTGLAVRPRQGDWSLLEAHLKDVICGGNEEHFTFLFDWLAHAVQKPQTKPGCAVVLRGRQKGSGKSTVSQVMQDLFGPHHAISLSQAGHFTGNFNAHLSKAIFVGIEEGFWAGDKQANSTVKDLITNDAIAYTAKGHDTTLGRNYSRFMFTSNEAHVVKADASERRYFVLEVENPQAGNKQYFDRLYKQLSDGGREAFLYALLNREITSDFYRPPVTKALLEQKEQSFSGIERAFLEFAREGCIETGDGVFVKLSRDGTTEIEKGSLRAAVEGTCKTTYEVRNLATRLGREAGTYGVTNSRSSRGGNRVRFYVFPPYEEYCRRVAEALGLDLEDLLLPTDEDCTGDGGEPLPF